MSSARYSSYLRARTSTPLSSIHLQRKLDICHDVTQNPGRVHYGNHINRSSASHCMVFLIQRRYQENGKVKRHHTVVLECAFEVISGLLVYNFSNYAKGLQLRRTMQHRNPNLQNLLEPDVSRTPSATRRLVSLSHERFLYLIML